MWTFRVAAYPAHCKVSSWTRVCMLGLFYRQAISGLVARKERLERMLSVTVHRLM